MYVYLIQSGNKPNSPIKIGMSGSPEKRIKQLQTGNPVSLRIVLSIKCNSRSDAFRLEKAMHQILKGQNILNEWYTVTRSNAYKALNNLANDPDFGRVENYVGLFAQPSEEDKARNKAKRQLNSHTNLSLLEQSMIKKKESMQNQVMEMEAKMRKRKAEAKAFRAELIRLGFAGSFDELLGRK